MELPINPLARFIDIYEELNKTKGYFVDSSSLRFAAITALCCKGEASDVARQIRSKGDEIKELSGWFGELNSPLRFIVSSILVLNDDDAADFLDEVKRVGKMFREADLRRGGIYETMAILLLRINGNKEPIQQDVIIKFKEIYEQMKKHHWWLTGPDDFPACAALTGINEQPPKVCDTVERIYQALKSKGFSSGDPLQTAANLLYLSNLDPNEAASRYHNISTLFKQKGVSIWQSDYDELAILSFLDHSAEVIVTRVLEHRERMKELRPQPDINITFNLAAGITFLELVQRDKSHELITGAKALIDMQNVINAQQAAAASAASSACVVSASASG
ncbi:MAG: hypothetical protein COA79_17875 [Planctomycetota bacterium]|nr:MAG: hypothetical protein COA79_17875 [Planctomycetota bacterium]